MGYFKQRKLKCQLKDLEDVTKILLATPNISFISQIQIIEEAYRLWQETN